MNTNQTLQEIIDNLPYMLRQQIMTETDVANLNSLKKQYAKKPNIIAVINARIQNLNYLVV